MLANDADANWMECRICHSKTTRDLILSPCLCKGSMGCVHIGCLEQWLNASSHVFCELCSYRFEVVRARRYSFCQSVRVWLKQDQGVYKALFFVILSAFYLALIGWMWFLWIINIPNGLMKRQPTDKAESVDIDSKMADHSSNEELGTAKWVLIFVFLTLLTLFSVKGLCIEPYKITRLQFRTWYRWWNEAVNIHLALNLQDYKISSKLEELKDLSVKYVNQEQQNDLQEERKQDIEGDESDLEEVQIGLPLVASGEDAKIKPDDQHTHQNT